MSRRPSSSHRSEVVGIPTDGIHPRECRRVTYSQCPTGLLGATTGTWGFYDRSLTRGGSRSSRPTQRVRTGDDVGPVWAQGGGGGHRGTLVGYHAGGGWGQTAVGGWGVWTQVPRAREPRRHVVGAGVVSLPDVQVGDQQTLRHRRPLVALLQTPMAGQVEPLPRADTLPVRPHPPPPAPALFAVGNRVRGVLHLLFDGLVLGPVAGRDTLRFCGRGGLGVRLRAACGTRRPGP